MHLNVLFDEESKAEKLKQHMRKKEQATNRGKQAQQTEPQPRESVSARTNMMQGFTTPEVHY